MIMNVFRYGVKRHAINLGLRLDVRSFSQSIKRLDNVEIKLKQAEEGYLTDPHLRILSSPLRRCQASMMVLPKMMMFKLLSYKDSSEEEEEAQFPLKKELQVEVDRLRAENQDLGRTDRWLLRQGKKALMERLDREAKMLKHKIVTCQSDQSRTKFTIELQQKKKEIGYMHIPKGFRKIGYDLGGMENHFEKIQKGHAKWCLLHVDAALALFDKRTFSSSDKNLKPEGFLSNIGKMLEKDLISTVKYLSTLNFKDEQLIWREIKEGKGGETDEALSAIVQTDSFTPTDAFNMQNTPSPTIYHIDQLFDQKNELKSEAIEALQGIVTRFQAQTSSNTDPFLIRKHKSTTNLCVALWRLNQWRDSMAKKAQ